MPVSAPQRHADNGKLTAGQHRADIGILLKNECLADFTGPMVY